MAAADPANPKHRVRTAASDGRTRRQNLADARGSDGIMLVTDNEPIVAGM
jgi:hypothetical protein